MARTERPRSVVAFEDTDREHPHVDTWVGAPIDDERIRALALAAPYLEYWESHHDELVFRRTEDDDTPREVCIDTLRDWWSVTGHDETLDTVGRLLVGMHASSYEVVHPLVTELLDSEDAPSVGAGSLRNRHRGFLVEAARFHGHHARYFTDDYEAWSQALCLGVPEHVGGPLPAEIRAWDLGRAVLVTRMAVTAGFLGEDEAWPLVMRALELAREQYPNWRQYAQAWQVGGSFWRASQDLSCVVADARTRRRQVVGCLSRPLSPWRRVELHPGYPVFTIGPNHRIPECPTAREG